MNLEGKINLIKDSVTAIKQAITGKNVTPSGNVSTYADAINNIVTPNNQTKTVTENGVVRYDAGYTGLEQVTVSLPLNSKSITTNGTYNASADNLQGYNSVTVNVQPNVDTKTITANGTYSASSDNLYGYNEVIVNVPNSIDDLIDGSITEVDTAVTSIKSSAFKDCEDLDTVVLRSNTVVDLNDDSIFEGTPIANRVGNIYVPNALINNYIENYNYYNTNNFVQATQNFNLGANDWRSLAYGDNKFVALGWRGKLSTSTDGITWAQATQNINLSSANDWYGLAYGNNKFVALSDDGYISTSTGGTNWTTATQILGSNNWHGLAYDGTKFVALGYRGYISTSTDGTTWTTSTQIANLGNRSWRALAYGNNKFVALGGGGHISTSIDGTTWTIAVQDTNLGEKGWQTLAYDGTKLVALSSTGYISTSTDGTTWTTAVQNTNLGENYWNGLVYSNNRFVTLGAQGYISYTLPKYNFLPISQLS